MRTKARILAAVLAAVATLLGSTAACDAADDGSVGSRERPGSPRPSAPATTPWPPAVLLSLLRRVPELAPDVVFDSRETFFPRGIEEYVEHPDARLMRASGKEIARACPRYHRYPKPPRVDLSCLGAKRYAGGARVRPGDTIRVSGDHEDWAASLRDEAPVYVRVAEGSDGKWYVQFLYFYVYNKSVGPFSHWADWEVAQVRMDRAARDPDALILSRHGGGEEIEWEDALREGRATFFPARGTHAGSHEAECRGLFRTDCNDGEGPTFRPQRFVLVDDQAGMDWPGLYGEIGGPVTMGVWDDPASLEF